MIVQFVPHLPIALRLSRRAAVVMRALSHVDRLRVTEGLLGGEQRVKDLAASLRLKPHITSQHLKELRAAGIVSGRRDGREVYYRVISHEAGAIIHALRRMHDAKATFKDGEAI